MSDQYDTLVVSVNETKSSNQTGINTNNSAVKITIDSATNGDTHGMLDVANNRLVAKVPGWYDINSFVLVSGTNVLANLYYTIVNKNGATIAYGNSPSSTASVAFASVSSTKVQLNVGDYLELFIFGQGNNSASTLTATSVSFAASRISGPSAIAATESVNARYYTAAGQSIPNTGATVVWGTKDYDSHGGMNTSTGVYTAPISGKYRITVQITWASASITVGAVKSAQLQKNGSAKSYIGLNYPLAATTAYIAAGGSDTVNLLAGDTISIYAGSGESSSRSLLNDGPSNFITIERIGN